VNFDGYKLAATIFKFTIVGVAVKLSPADRLRETETGLH